ncbi:hypothetical protein M433DRAFT_140394 [Acidomyces richmondensis BFW]|nr:hypothetical protein M433DRAFT_140394 [Acidomyces richmondensis BFW]
MVKAAIFGAAGQIGSPLSLLLKSSNLLTELSIYDVVNAPGVATDLNHIDTPAKVTGYLSSDNNGLQMALNGADIVIIPAGIARKPGVTRDDLFQNNAKVIKDLVTGVAKFCPRAFVLIITNPINSTLPIAVEVLKRHNVLDPQRVFGATTLDVVRASTFLAHVLQSDNPKDFKIPVVGGHSGSTILPLYSQCKPSGTLNMEELDSLTHHKIGFQFGGDKIVQVKVGAGSATTCMAYVAVRFVNSLLTAIFGPEGSIEEAYIAETLGVDYFAVPVDLGSQGLVRALGIGELSKYERHLLEFALPRLRKDIEKGLKFSKGKGIDN